MGGTMVLVAAVIGAPALKDRPDPAAGLHGEWVVESLTCSGNPFRFGGEARMRFSPDGGWGFAVRGVADPGQTTRYAVDTKASPPALDLTAGGPDRPPALVGVYRLEGDRLTLCYREDGGSRPTEFQAGLGSGQSLMVLRRVTPAPGK